MSSGARAGASEAATGARRFQGQTSWQMSQPKTWRPMGARRDLVDGPFFSMVR